jgi:type IV pilus assembly protein PilV
MQASFAAGSQRGATLIEVLVAVAVSSVGLLGLAGLLAASVRLNQGAYQRTQISLSAQALIESMHVNPVAVAQGRYDGTYSGSRAASQDCTRQACNASARANDDAVRFARALNAAVPNAKAMLACHASAGAPGASGVYDGLCRLEIDWSERALAQGGDATPQTLAWVFQP